MKRGEIWQVDLEPVSGREQQGRRPVLVISTEPFAKTTGVALICPITGGGDLARDAGFAVSLATTGLRTTGVVVVSQMRMVDLKARKAKRIEVVPDFIVDEVLAKAQAILD